MRIGELEKHSGASRHTLRYYERLGLISAARRDNNYREYSPQTLKDLGFIQQAQNLGFSLGEIAEILKARREQQLDCVMGSALVGRKLLEVEAKIASLKAMRRFLRSEKSRLEQSAAQAVTTFREPESAAPGHGRQAPVEGHRLAANAATVSGQKNLSRRSNPAVLL
jgi:DNA-binding transcriptional MerR regulator